MKSMNSALLALLLAFGSRALNAGADAPVRMVPFQRAPSPYVVIPVPIKGQGCTSLLFDTGTNLSILDPDLAARLPVTNGRKLTVASAAGQVAARTGVVTGLGFELTPETSSPDIVVTGVDALRDLAGNVSGIFGQSLLGETDYFIDYKAKRLTLGAPRQLTTAVTGARMPLEWSEGRPAIDVAVRAPSGAIVPVRLVLDSGIDRVTMFGASARRLVAMARSTTAVKIEGPLGSTTAAAAPLIVLAADRDPAVVATLMIDVGDRQEDGLLPTSLFRSVFISAADRVVVLDGVLRIPSATLSAGVRCGAGDALAIAPGTTRN